MWILPTIVLISIFVLLFDGHTIRKQNEDIKIQNEKILAEIKSLNKH